MRYSLLVADFGNGMAYNADSVAEGMRRRPA